MTHETNQPEKNDQRATQGLDPAPVDEPCRVVVVPLASGQSVTVSMRSVAPLTGEEEAALGEIVRAAAARMEREHPHAGVITALWQASLRSRVVLRAAGEGDLADRLGAAIRSASEVIRSAWVSGVASSLKSTPEDLTQAAGDSGPGGVTRREEIAQAILAWFHDGSTTEWPGEIDAYRSLAGHLLAAGGLGADRDSRFRWAEEAARLEAALDAERLAHAGTQGERDAGDDFAELVRGWLGVPDEVGWANVVYDRIRLLRWLHAEAVWQRDQLRERGVLLPDDAAAQLVGAASSAIWRDARIAARDTFADLIESWRPVESAPPGWPCKCGTDETDMVHTVERCYSATEPVAAHRPRDTDDPSEDGIGVWRQDDPEDGGYIFRKTGLVDRPDGPWLSPYTGEYLTNEEMRGCRRISVTFAPAETESVAAPESTNAPAIQFDAAKGAFFRLGSDNHLDPSSVLSLHWVGDDIHLRIQHEGEDQYAVVALNLGDRTDLVNALSQQRTVPNV